MLSLSASSLHRILQARIPEWVAIPFSMGFFPPQGLNPGLLYCRQILHPLSHQGSPIIIFSTSLFIHIHFRLLLTATLSLKVREWIWIFTSTYFIVWVEVSGVRLSVYKSWLHFFSYEWPWAHDLPILVLKFMLYEI